MNAQTIDYPKLQKQVDAHPYPLLFATISGSHMYGFPSPNSDFDLRGAHCLPRDQVLGLKPLEETVEKSGIHDGLESVERLSSIACTRKPPAHTDPGPCKGSD